MRYIVQGNRVVSHGGPDGPFTVDSVPSFYVDTTGPMQARNIARLIVTGESSPAGKKHGKGLDTVHIVFNCHAEVSGYMQ